MRETGKQGPVGVHRTRVEWVDTDAAGIYHNTAVVRFVESAEAALMRERGLHDYFPKAPACDTRWSSKLHCGSARRSPPSSS